MEFAYSGDRVSACVRCGWVMFRKCLENVLNFCVERLPMNLNGVVQKNYG